MTTMHERVETFDGRQLPVQAALDSAENSLDCIIKRYYLGCSDHSNFFQELLSWSLASGVEPNDREKTPTAVKGTAVGVEKRRAGIT